MMDAIELCNKELNKETKERSPSMGVIMRNGVQYAGSNSGSGASSAINVSYDNTLTQLSADNVQTAIDKISIKVAEFTPSELPVTNFIRSKNGVYYKNIDLPSELANSIIIGFQLKNWSGCNGLFTINYYEPLNCIQIMATSSITINVFTINIIYI